MIQLYDIEREVRGLDAAHRNEYDRSNPRPLDDAMHLWLLEQRRKLPEASATIKAIEHSLKRWTALTRYIDDGNLPGDNNWVENQIRRSAPRAHAPRILWP